LTVDLGGEDGDLPEIRRVRLEEQEALRVELESQLLHNATMLADYGLKDFSRHALDHPDDRLRATLVILDAALAPSWAPLLNRGQHLGLAGLVTGEWAGAQRTLRLDGEGLLHLEAPGLDSVSVTPCVLPSSVIEE